MYLIAIAWLYVTLLMAATEHSVTAGILTFLFYGLIPCTLLLWVMGTGHRKRKRVAKEAAENLLQDELGQSNRKDT